MARWYGTYPSDSEIRKMREKIEEERYSRDLEKYQLARQYWIRSLSPVKWFFKDLVGVFKRKRT